MSIFRANMSIFRAKLSTLCHFVHLEIRDIFPLYY